MEKNRASAGKLMGREVKGREGRKWEENERERKQTRSQTSSQGWAEGKGFHAFLWFSWL